MKRILLITAALLCSFLLGYAMHSILSPAPKPLPLKRVTGVGGIFFKCKDPKKLKSWYRDHLGLEITPYGAKFEWREAADSTSRGYTQWSAFAATTKYFEPSTADFMINYRVADMDGLVKALKTEGVTIVDTVETYSYGKFLHIMDEEGHKVELWEPIDK
jgi:catechol 2,3-dioxygenase-like lactoylglutathione lyase family enzyme